MRKKVFIFVGVVTCGAVCAAQTAIGALAPGVITGAVKGSDGTVITSGSVSAVRTPDRPIPRLGRISASAAIGPDGGFQLPAQVDGAYQMCAQVPGSVWLNPCEWALVSPISVSLSGGQVSASPTVVLPKGALVTVQVNDPKGFLLANAGAQGALLLIGVSTDSRYFKTATLISENASGRTYQILVPFGRSIDLSVTSGLFQLTDSTDTSLPSVSLIPILVPSGQQPSAIVLNVAGIAAP